MGSKLTLLNQSQQGLAFSANALFQALEPAALFACDWTKTSGLNWFYYGGGLIVDGSLAGIPSNTVALALTASANNYIECTRAGVVSVNTTGFTPGRIPLYLAVTGASTITGSDDYRNFAQGVAALTSKASVTVTTTDVTLSALAARCRYLTVTGALTGNRALIVPNDWEGIVYNATTGPYTLTVKTASGSGVPVTQSKRVQLFADGTNVVPTAPEV